MKNRYRKIIQEPSVMSRNQQIVAGVTIGLALSCWAVVGFTFLVAKITM